MQREGWWVFAQRFALHGLDLRGLAQEVCGEVVRGGGPV